MTATSLAGRAASKAVAKLRPSDETDVRRSALEGQLRGADEEAARLVASIAAGDEFPAVREALRDVERRRAHLRTQLPALDGLGRAVTLDGARLERELNDSLDDRHSSLLAGHVPRARQILRKLLSDRIPFSPRSDGASRRYEFTRHGELGRIFAGLRAAHGGVSPTGLARIDARIFGRPPSRSSAN